ncbi:NACHT domain-containing protein [Actinomadura barringtoniae]|uniref:NACHT domain-containing protein n=1 Tax=Actinomadura barringtoniae TaxID=1427535 RepID=A0A939PE21_9ACTN|nr:NACHT domain-containing protein [Actinomadura barringtoniae]MBO2451122.1 NACHT domain-containing protein [Actinomadura barringtoniae]
MSVEVAVFGVGRSVAQLAVRRWLAGRSAKGTAAKDLAELVKVGFPDEIKRRRATRQFEDIADSVGERLLTFARQEFGGLADGDREAVLFEVVRTLDGADLSDDAFFAADADPVKLSRSLRARLPEREARFQLGEAGARLYEVVLDECCDCLARIIVHLPQFEPRASVETLGRLSGLADQVGAVLARLPARTLAAPEGQSHDEEFTRRYLASISENLDTLELFGVRFERLTRPQTTLSVAYISLNVSDEIVRRPKDWRFEEERESSSIRVEAALGEHRLMLLRGEAGGGKSTLLRWLAVMAARGAFTDELAEWNGCTPFLIKLRSHATGPLPRPEEYLDDVAGNLSGLMPRGWVHRRLTSGRALLLVDGVDEITGARRQQVRQWLKEIVNEFRGIRVIVTSRPAAADAKWLRAEGFASAFLEQLGPSDIRALVQQWHTAVLAGDELPCAPERLPSYEARLLARFEAAPHLRMLASSPLLAAVLCALNLDREALPRDRMGLYAAALDLLLETRDARRGVPQAAQLERDQKVRVLQDIAWHLSTSGRVELPKPMVERVIATRLASMPQVDARASDVLEALLQRSGIIREPVLGRIDFVHRTVQEYLAAKQAADLGDMDLLIQNAHRDQWRETVIMAAGHANEPLRRELVSGLLARITNEPSRARVLKLVVVACLETLPSVPSDLAREIDRCLDDLVPPRSLAAARSLATAGEAVLSRLPQTLDGLSDAAAQAAVRTTWMINGPASLDVLARYARDPRHSVQWEVGEAWQYFDTDEYADRVLAGAAHADHTLRPTTARQVKALGRLRPRPEITAYPDGVSGFDFLNVHAASLRQLMLYWNEPGADLSLLPRMPNLRDLTIRLPGMPDLDFLNDIPPLDYIWLTRCENIADFSPLDRHMPLEGLVLFRSHQLTSLDMLPPLTTLGTLGLDDSALTCGLHDVVAAAPNLTVLYLSGCGWVTALEPLEALRPTVLNLSGTRIDSVAPLANQDSLVFLNLSETDVADLEPLRGAKDLNTLHLVNCTRVTDLSPLADLPKLEFLYISGMTPGIDVSPLAGNRKVEIYYDAGQEIRGGEPFKRRLKIF